MGQVNPLFLQWTVATDPFLDFPFSTFKHFQDADRRATGDREPLGMAAISPTATRTGRQVKVPARLRQPTKEELIAAE